MGMRYVIRERFFRISEDSDITNEAGEPVLQVDGKVLSLHHTLVLRDPAGNEVARVQQKLIALRPTFEITRGGQEVAEVRKQLISPFIDRYTIDIPGPDDLHIMGSLLEHEYTIERQGEVVATVSKRWISLTGTYAVDIAPGQDNLVILASVLALDIAHDEEHAR
jgi:uncharacterized protein YxjI